MDKNNDYIVCPFCGKKLPVGTLYCDNCLNEVAAPKKIAKNLILIIIAIILVVFVFYKYWKKKEPPVNTNSPVAVQTETKERVTFVSSEELDEFIKSYSRRVVEKLNKRWLAYDSFNNKASKATVQFRIARNGGVYTNKIIVSSGDDEFDERVLNTVIQSAPFDPFSSKYGIGYIDAKYEFEVGRISAR